MYIIYKLRHEPSHVESYRIYDAIWKDSICKERSPKLFVVFLGGEGNEVEVQANVALRQPWHLIHLLPDFQQIFQWPRDPWFSAFQFFLCHLGHEFHDPRGQCLNPNWGNVFDGLDCFQRKWLVRKVALCKICDFEDLRADIQMLKKQRLIRRVLGF